MDESLQLTSAEIKAAFAEPHWAGRFPPLLTIEQAAELLQLPVETIRSWRSRRLLNSCSRKKGKRVRFLRDRLIAWYFNDSQ